jgi:signal transduction histidine kinase
MHNGTGLGLFIAHQNMLDHGGTIEVQSKESEGATFILTLPSRPA